MYNEKKTAPESAKILCSFFDQKEGLDYEIIFSDDGSTDFSYEAVKKLGLPNVKAIRYDDNRGKGSAVREGIVASEGKVVIYTDCDLAYGTDALYQMYQRLVSDDIDIVIGSRNIGSNGYEGYTVLRKLMSKSYIKLLSFVAGFHYSDSQCGIKGFTSGAAKKIFEKCAVNGFAFDLEVLLIADREGLKINEMPVKVINHRQSDSKVHPIKDAFKMLSDLNRIKKNIKKQ